MLFLFFVRCFCTCGPLRCHTHTYTHTHTLARSNQGTDGACGGREQQKVEATPCVNYNNEAGIVWYSQSARGANLAWPDGGAGSDGGGTGLTTKQIHGRVDHTQSYICRHRFRFCFKHCVGSLMLTSSVVVILA